MKQTEKTYKALGIVKAALDVGELLEQVGDAARTHVIDPAKDMWDHVTEEIPDKPKATARPSWLDDEDPMASGLGSYVPFIGGAINSATNPHPFRRPGVDSGETWAGIGGGTGGAIVGGTGGLIASLLAASRGKVGKLEFGKLLDLLSPKKNRWIQGGAAIGSSLGTHGAVDKQRRQESISAEDMLNLMRNLNPK